MRELKIEEARIILGKIIKFQGQALTTFLKTNYFSFLVFKLQKKRLFFSSFSLFSRALNFSKKRVGSLGFCIGRFTRSKKFRFLIPFLNLLQKNKILLVGILHEKGEKLVLYGNHVNIKNIAKLSKNILKNDGLLFMNRNRIPLGFGEILKSGFLLAKCDQKIQVLVNQGDTGLYIRTI